MKVETYKTRFKRGIIGGSMHLSLIKMLNINDFIIFISFMIMIVKHGVACQMWGSWRLIHEKIHHDKKIAYALVLGLIL